jgi:hypothetical protein
MRPSYQLFGMIFKLFIHTEYPIIPEFDSFLEPFSFRLRNPVNKTETVNKRLQDMPSLRSGNPDQYVVEVEQYG